VQGSIASHPARLVSECAICNARPFVREPVIFH